MFFGREEAQRQYEEERRKKREKAEYQREKVREGIRQKYGIEKKTNDKKTNPAAIEVRKANIVQAPFFTGRMAQADLQGIMGSIPGNVSLTWTFQVNQQSCCFRIVFLGFPETIDLLGQPH